MGSLFILSNKLNTFLTVLNLVIASVKYPSAAIKPLEKDLLQSLLASFLVLINLTF